MNRTQMLKGILEGCVLKLLQDKELYSQEIVMHLKEHGFDEMSEGTLYPMLLRLEKEGLFSTRKRDTRIGPSRKYYALSDKGQLELAEFLRQWQDFKESVDGIMSGKAPGTAAIRFMEMGESNE